METKETGLAVREPDGLLPTPPPVANTPAEMTADDLLVHAAKVHDVLQKCMKEGVHYGKIPGCPKPSLWQPGAEKLCLVFHLAPIYHGREKDWQPNAKRDYEQYNKPKTCTGFLRWTTICRIMSPSGTVVAEGMGTCNNWEPNFIMKDPYGIEETILQMARKRALVNAARTATAASDIFTQDDDVVESGGAESSPPRQTTARASTPSAGAPSVRPAPRRSEPRQETSRVTPGTPPPAGATPSARKDGTIGTAGDLKDNPGTRPRRLVAEDSKIGDYGYKAVLDHRCSGCDKNVWWVNEDEHIRTKAILRSGEEFWVDHRGKKRNQPAYAFNCGSRASECASKSFINVLSWETHEKQGEAQPEQPGEEPQNGQEPFDRLEKLARALGVWSVRLLNPILFAATGGEYADAGKMTGVAVAKLIDRLESMAADKAAAKESGDTVPPPKEKSDDIPF